MKKKRSQNHMPIDVNTQITKLHPRSEARSPKSLPSPLLLLLLFSTPIQKPVGLDTDAYHI